MATIAPRAVGDTSPRAEPLALAVADANWFTTENLFREVQRPGVSTLLLKCLDYYNAWLTRKWPWTAAQGLTQPGAQLWHRDLVLPSGWMKSYPSWGMRPIRRSIEDWRRRYVPQGKLALVMTYPHYLYLRDQLRPDYQIYFNIDDYAQYWPSRAHRVNELERQAVREADLTVCASRWRCDQLRAAAPEAADRIQHLPHGTPTTSLDPAPCFEPAAAPAELAALPRPYLGYVGSLEDRIDWELLDRVAEAFPQASIVLVGRLANRGSEAWRSLSRQCLARANVHHLGWRPQAEIAAYNRAFDVCLIPYRTDHPFNQACSPTKIMDYMGTGRPIVSTALPECLLYDQLFDVAPDTESFLAAIDRLLRQPDDGLIGERHAHAQANTCSRVVERLLDWLPR